MEENKDNTTTPEAVSQEPAPVSDQTGADTQQPATEPVAETAPAEEPTSSVEPTVSVPPESSDEPVSVPVEAPAETPEQPAEQTDTITEEAETKPSESVAEVEQTEKPEDTKPALSAEQAASGVVTATPKKKHVLVMAISIVVMLALVGAAVYAYLDRSTVPVSDEANGTSQTADPAPTDSVDSTSSDIDASIDEIEKAGALEGEDLSDESLGL